MSTTTFRRKVVLFLLLAIFAVPWASAAGPAREEGRSAEASASPLDLLNHLWSFLTSAWSDEGCSLDPNGIPRCAPEPQEEPDTGCSLDPDGRCAS